MGYTNDLEGSRGGVRSASRRYGHIVTGTWSRFTYCLTRAVLSTAYGTEKGFASIPCDQTDNYDQQRQYWVRESLAFEVCCACRLNSPSALPAGSGTRPCGAPRHRQHHGGCWHQHP